MCRTTNKHINEWNSNFYFKMCFKSEVQNKSWVNLCLPALFLSFQFVVSWSCDMYMFLYIHATKRAHYLNPFLVFFFFGFFVCFFFFFPKVSISLLSTPFTRGINEKQSRPLMDWKIVKYRERRANKNSVSSLEQDNWTLNN